MDEVALLLFILSVSPVPVDAVESGRFCQFHYSEHIASIHWFCPGVEGHFESINSLEWPVNCHLRKI